MTREILFVQGGAEGAYDADARLAASLRQELGAGYEVRYPKMPNEDEPDYRAWTHAISENLARMGDGAIVVGHSIGGSVLVKWLTEHAPRKSIAGLFVIAAPFWRAHEFWRWDEVALAQDAGAKFPQDIPLFFYHGRADEFVPCAHVEMYAKVLPHASVRRLEGRNHQLGDDLSDVARDIRSIANKPNDA